MKTKIDYKKASPPMSSITNETEKLYMELLDGTRIPVTLFEKELAKQIQEGRDDPKVLIMDIPHDI
jgi:hypothetical protein